MALNPNHSFEELGDVKCSVVEKNCSQARVDFLKALLEFNRFTVVIAKSPPPKAAKPAAAAAGTEAVPAAEVKVPETFTVGVTDLSFSVVNAIFNRELKTPDGAVVFPNYWYQKEASPVKDQWYWK